MRLLKSRQAVVLSQAYEDLVDDLLERYPEVPSYQ